MSGLLPNAPLQGEPVSGDTSRRFPVWGEWICLCLTFGLVGLWYTNPLWRHWGAYLVDGADPLHNVCVSGWLSRRILAGRLSGIWDVPPIYYPARLTLTYTDPQIGVTLLGLPIYAFTRNIVAAYNFVVVISMPLCALGAYALARHLTGSRGAALIAGIAWGFGAWHAAHASHQQLLSLEALPWLLLCMHRYGETKQDRYLVGIFLWWVVQEYLCEYWGMFLILLIGPFALILLRLTYRLRGRDLAKPWIAIALAILAWMPAQWLFLVQVRQGHQHGAAMVIGFSANLAHYLPEPGSWLLGQWEHPGLSTEFTLTLGAVVLGLAFLMILLLFRHTRQSAAPLSPTRAAIGRVLARVAPVGLIVSAIAWIIMGSLGTNDLTYLGLTVTLVNSGTVSRLFLVSLLLWLNAPLLAWLREQRVHARDVRHPLLPYVALAFLAAIWSCGYSIRFGGTWLCPGVHWLVAWLPGVKSFRVLARMGIFADLALAMLAAGGAAHCLRMLRERGLALPLRATGTAAVCILVLVENVPRTGTPFAFSSACLPAPRAVDTWLASQPPGPLVELPLGGPEMNRMWYQLRHQNPTMNGFGTFTRPGYGQDADLLRNPQSPAAIARLRALGVKYVIVDASMGGAHALASPYRLRFEDTVAAAFELPR